MNRLLIITKRVDKNDQLLGFFVDWLNRFARRFKKITIFCLEKGQFDLPGNVRVLSLGKDMGLSKPRQLLNFYSLVFSIRNDYDAVFVHMNPIWMALGGLWWKLTRKKQFLWYTSKGVTLKLRIAEIFADKIFTASPESFRLRSKKVIVTGHGIDTELFRPVSKATRSDLRILSVGRISPVKNYDVLVNAAKILKDDNIEFTITIIGEPALAGDKDYELGIRNKIKDLELENRFNFLGKINHNDLPKYYQSNDIFIHLSKTGSLDKTILEAMASGMKVISSNDASRGFLPPELVVSEDNAKELANKIKKIMTNNNPYHLREYVENNHNLDKLIDKISALIINEKKN